MNNIMQDSLEYDFLFKYILVGDTSVGKTSLLASYNNNQFLSNSNPTMGVQFATKKIQMGGKVIKLQIWDTAGQESFRTITRAYYKNAIGVILVYDLTQQNTVAGLQSWLTQIQENSNEQVQIVVAGNKKDVVSQPRDSDRGFSEKMNKFKRYYTSAKTGYNVSKLFTELTAEVLSKIQRNQIKIDGNHGVKKGNSNRNNAKLKKTIQLEQKQSKANSSKCC